MGGPSWPRYLRSDPYAGLTLLAISIATLLTAYRILFLEKFGDQEANMIFGFTFVIMGAFCIILLIRRIHSRGLRGAFKFDPKVFRVYRPTPLIGREVFQRVLRRNLE